MLPFEELKEFLEVCGFYKQTGASTCRFQSRLFKDFIISLGARHIQFDVVRLNRKERYCLCLGAFESKHYSANDQFKGKYNPLYPRSHSRVHREFIRKVGQVLCSMDAAKEILKNATTTTDIVVKEEPREENPALEGNTASPSSATAALEGNTASPSATPTRTATPPSQEYVVVASSPSAPPMIIQAKESQPQKQLFSNIDTPLREALGAKRILEVISPTKYPVITKLGINLSDTYALKALMRELETLASKVDSVNL